MSVLMAVGMTACVDDDLVFRDSITPHGEAMVNIEAAFEPFTSSTMSSRANQQYWETNGEIMKDVSDVVLLAYDVNGDLLDGFPMELTGYTEKDEPRTGANTSNGGLTTDTLTKCLTKTIKLFYGDYYLVAVANMGEYAADGNGGISISKKTITVFKEMAKDKYNTLDALRKLRREWKTDNFRNNREMCGYFVDKADKNASNPSASGDFHPVHVDRDGMTLRTWMRRLASKVTVDFDGTGLRENVKIYIKDVKIYDLASSCTLGFGKTKPAADEHYISYNNTVGSDDDVAKGTHAAMLHEGSHVINFYDRYKGDAASPNDDGHQDWPRISKGSPYIYVDPAADIKEKADLHANNAPSLFFYENMQGDAPNGKGPIVDLVGGGVANSGVEKENVPYGTYIEVTAYYESEASNNISNGPIKYRFMLGKDAVKNCDAERNYHYKVTLKFNGNANEFSWHIDYKEEPDTWDVPQPWYVSYLYNHQTTIPFKYTPPEGYEVVYFEAKITKNPWWPDEDPGIPIPPDNGGAINETANRQIGNGFLSLRQTSSTVITPQDCGESSFPGYDNKDAKTVEKTINLNNKYFLGESTASKGLNRSIRRFNVSNDSEYDDTQDNYADRPKEKYSYQRRDLDQSVSLNMPLFTRAKVLVKQTAYSGNNPYVGYTRTAQIEMTPYVRPKGTKATPEARASKIIEVEQVRRIVNPKGVYRRSGNNQDFNVHLLELPGDQASTFQDFKSDGPWIAEILGDKNFITLDGKQTVTGSTGSSITFNIRFNKLNTGNTVRNAVVRVRYNSYTCTHLIFVRQGYDPQAISESAREFGHLDGTTPVKWRTFNRVAARLDAKDPRDEGSLFKHGSIWNAIDSYNNCYKDIAADGKRDGMGIYTAPSEGEFISDDASNGKYRITNGDGTLGDEVNWDSFSGSIVAIGDDAGWSSMATMRHFEQLYATPNIQFGFGVLYADGATSTQFEVSDAYGYYRRDPENSGPKGPDPNYGTDSRKGMRGLFVYFWNENEPNNSYTGKNLFFPIGRSGYGHRKHGSGGKEDAANVGKGILRYSSSGYTNRGWLFNKTAPLFAAAYYRPGAIYYAKGAATDSFLDWTGGVGNSGADGKAIGMDINYFSFDVNMIGAINLADGNDACMVRFVE